MPVSPDVGNKLLGWVLLGAGSVLAYSAVRNRKPWDVLRDIQGEPAFGSGSGSSGPSGFANPNNPTGPVDTTPTGNLAQIVVRVRAIQNREIPPVLVNIKPSGQLDKDAAASFRRVQERGGKDFGNVGNYRTYAYQAAKYAENPRRYGSPDKSAHVVGLAIDIVDVDIQAALPHLLFEGWQQTRPGDEPWHFSYLIRA